MRKYPYHRYLRHLVLEGFSPAEVVQAIDSIFFIPPRQDEVAALSDEIYKGRSIDSRWRDACDTTVFFDKSRDMSLCLWIAENSDTSLLTQRLLLDKVSCVNTATIVSIKAGRNVTSESISLFKKCFWDTDALSRIDFNNYYAMGNFTPPDPPAGAPLSMRPGMAAWEAGIIPPEEEISTNDIIRTIQVDSFMTFQKSRVSACRKDREESIKWANLALRTSNIIKDHEQKASDSEMFKLKPIIVYPPLNVKSLADVSDNDQEDEDPI